MESNFAKVILGSGKDQSVRRFHPWIFSGAIKKIKGEVQEGDVVEVYSNHDELLAMGHYQSGSIAVRVFANEAVTPDVAFWTSKIQDAFDTRQAMGLVDNEQTNVYRLLFGEGDGMPGLIIDFYNGTAVLQSHSVGMHRSRLDIAEALKNVLQHRLKAIYDKSDETLPKNLELPSTNGLLWGETLTNEVLENGLKFNIDWEKGQKTGFFIDQRDNRLLLANYCKGKKVLNTFCYSGGFSVYAIQAGASLVHSVDSSKKAIELTEGNVALNFPKGATHESFAIDTFAFLESTKEEYDVIILDPPAFAKHQHVKHNAVQGYKRLNAETIRKIKPGGILFTFSCSQVVDTDLFNSTIMSAAIQAGRRVRVLHHLSQSADHAPSIFHPEGQYLKGLVLKIE